MCVSLPVPPTCSQGANPGPQAKQFLGDYPGRVILNPDCLHVFRSEYDVSLALLLQSVAPWGSRPQRRAPWGVGRDYRVGPPGGQDHGDGPCGGSGPQSCVPALACNYLTGPWDLWKPRALMGQF